jgi:Bacterial protein of unknown function (DUF937)
MALIFDVLSAINNPNQQANVGQLETITQALGQTAATHGLNSAQMPTVLSALGSVVGPALAQQKELLGGEQVENLIHQAGSSGSASALQALFSGSMQNEMIQSVAQKTGLNPSMLQPLVITLLPTILGFLNMGSAKPGQQGSNALLNTFLDSDHDGDTDLGDVMKFAGRFLN